MMGVLLAMLLVAVPDAGAGSSTRTVQGRVVDAAGGALQGVVVFAADSASDAIATVATSDRDGQVQLAIPDRRHDFGVLSARFGVSQLTSTGPGSFTLVLRPLPADPRPVGPSKDAGAGAAVPATRPPEQGHVAIVGGRASVIRGRVVDETGQGLAGIRVEGIRPTGTAAAVAISGPNGVFALAVPGGETRLDAYAPGLKLVRSSVPTAAAGRGAGRARVVLVMGVAADIQNIVVTAGRVLRVRPQDSIDPEYSPPAPVKAWLLYAYGICAQTKPMTRAQKQALKKYWYLDVLRRDPPNPASIAGGNCSPPSLYDQPSLRVTAGFGSLVDFVGPPPE
jgi:hypothetical protein